MNAMLAKYLKDFSVPDPAELVEDDILSSLAGSPFDGSGLLVASEPEIDHEAERNRAHEEGYAEAVAECEQRFADEIGMLEERHADELRALTEHHENEAMAVIHARFHDMTLAISQSLADQALQALLPVFEADLARRSVTALADAVQAAFAEEKAADVLVRGPARLYQLLQPRFESDGIACRHIQADTTDIMVEINDTVLTTRLASWAQSLAEVTE